jgi:hypothetical protein
LKQRPPNGGRSLFGVDQTMTYTHSPQPYFRYGLITFIEDAVSGKKWVRYSDQRIMIH